jgi:malonate-semialdehyde dehydrogenase (acetylating)/methylmalonate-semialdehyde dehydrogenase
MSNLLEPLEGVQECRNWIAGAWQPTARGLIREITSPYSGRVLGHVGLSTTEDVAAAVEAALRVAPGWAATPVKERVRPLQRFYELAQKHAESLAQTIAAESGKLPSEALAGLQRGLEVVEFALSLPNLDRGGALEVSRGVSCEYRREPLGVVAGVTPFNFPAMVPLWMFPIALTLGNAFVLKPSEKTPLTAGRLASLLGEAGYAPGLFSVIHGDRTAVEAIVDHPQIRAIGFVGSTAVARAVHARATAQGKRALCLGGAKNHLIVMPDADEALTVKGVVDSFTGCAGQRCMAASVLVLVGPASRFLPSIVASAARIELGRDMGALIDHAARERLVGAVTQAESEGARVVLDGRNAHPPAHFSAGSFLGPTILDGARPDMAAAKEELFGPVLTVLRVDTLDQALELERDSPYGNAVSVFTTNGAVARHVVERATSGMVGINVGVPVPRDPFSFGGTKESKYGTGDITGPGGVELWSNLKKVTTKWAPATDSSWMS